MKKIAVNNIDSKAFGEEPTWATQDNSEPEIRRAYNFYNYHCDGKDGRKFVEEYMESIKLLSHFKEEIAAAEDWRFAHPNAWLCRMAQKGYKLSDEQKDSIEQWLTAIEGAGQNRLEEKRASAKPGVVIDIQKRIAEKASGLIADLDEHIDLFAEYSECKAAFDPYNFFRSKDAKAIYMPKIIDHYKPLAAELEIAVKGKDEEVNEIYRLYTKKQIRAFSDFVNKILEDAKLYAGNQKKAHAPRKRKAKSAEQLTKNVRYQKTDADLKLISVSPTLIIGASEVWIFNTKTRVAAHYVAIDRGGLTVRGSGIKNFDETLSFKRKIRKPEEFLPIVLSGGSKATLKEFEKLKTKATACNGRLNNESVILRAMK